MMNTVSIKSNRVRELVSDLKKWRIRHLPFYRQGNMIYVTMYDSPKVDWVILKYS